MTDPPYEPVSAARSPAPGSLWSVRLIQAGKLKDVPYDGKPWTTAIYKTPIAGSVAVDRFGIAGDEHTGSGRDPERALCCVPTRHYGYWRAYFREALPLGVFGENLTLEGLAEEDLCIGDVLRCGGVVMQVSQPRMPCYKQARRIGQPDFVKLILQTGKLGFLTRILESGTLETGDALELVERPHPEIGLPFVMRALQRPDEKAAAELAALPLLANEWRERFAAQATRRG